MKDDLQIKVEYVSSCVDYYRISYRKKRIINLFNFWNPVLDIPNDYETNSYNIPVLFYNFDDAIEYAKNLKENQHLIDEMNYKLSIQRKKQEKRKKITII